MAVADTTKRRRAGQLLAMWLLPVIIIGGLYWPYLGFALAGMAVFYLALALFRGRLWCGWVCPRGAFLEIAMARVSRRRRVPALFRTTAFRCSVFVALLALMLFRVWQAGTVLEQLGFVFITMGLLTTAIALPLSIVFHPRAWCVVCPMGTLQGVLGGNRNAVKVSAACVDCGVCAQNCPLTMAAGAHQAAGLVPGADCSKCSTCIVKCPQQALS